MATPRVRRPIRSARKIVKTVSDVLKQVCCLRGPGANSSAACPVIVLGHSNVERYLNRESISRHLTVGSLWYQKQQYCLVLY